MDVDIQADQKQPRCGTACGYCFGHEDECLHPVSKLQSDNGTPFQYNYLVGLFSAPDMVTYLSESSIDEDIHALPIHLQRLLSEAKEEVVLARSHRKNQQEQQEQQQQQPLESLTRLNRVRNYVQTQSGGDMANMMSALTELMSDDDELETVLGF